MREKWWGAMTRQQAEYRRREGPGSARRYEKAAIGGQRRVRQKQAVATLGKHHLIVAGGRLALPSGRFLRLEFVGVMFACCLTRMRIRHRQRF